LEVLPDVPTVDEFVPGYEASSWFGVGAPKGTSEEIDAIVAEDAVGAPHVGERTERELIAAFCDKIAELSPQLVTFNGNSFDLPVLRYRAMVHGVAAPGLSVRPYFHRYTEDAIDLCDARSVRRARPLFTRSAESWACLESPRGSTAVRSSVISVRARSRRSPTTARPT
jgi:predicted PolB exonuclease-like 3'-5' exonuclease